MAALQSLTKGLPSPNQSFADIVTAKTQYILLKEKLLCKEEPVVFFLVEDIEWLSAPFKLDLIGKFSRGKPPMVVLHKEFPNIGLKGGFQLGFPDYWHILLETEATREESSLDTGEMQPLKSHIVTNALHDDLILGGIDNTKNFVQSVTTGTLDSNRTLGVVCSVFRWRS
ncbi:hypothetical protein ACH5RR_006749 [Cinchona calisaya]|uniref:Uncharacterized protein n=1 Tax=Cinchona calisaya TaxID=153742 RepID=A0ABD3APV6_9GENT